jgi:hypothetical protein
MSNCKNGFELFDGFIVLIVTDIEVLKIILYASDPFF